MAIESINPASNELIREYREMSHEEVTHALRALADEFGRWRRVPLQQRAACLTTVAELLRARTDRYSRIITQEMGKPLRDSRTEIEKCAWVCEYYAENGALFLAEEVVETEATESLIAYQPLGTVLAVMPWNFPFWQFFRFGAAALIAGNTVALKHSSNVTGCALAIEQVLGDAGFSEDVFRVLVVGGRRIAEIIERPEISAATLTGSTPAGRSLAEACGRNLKKCVLELGGSDPYVVLEDADLDHAVSSCVTARIVNSGQSCIAGKRFIVVEPVADEFERRFVEAMAEQTVGDPMDEDTAIGPLASVGLRNELHDQVERSIRGGAVCLAGGEVPEGPGAYYPATVLTSVAAGMPAYEEELFGPVAAIIRVKDEAEAIKVANDTFFGLGGAVFTTDLDRGKRIARDEIEAGCVFVNEFVRSDPRMPFGGVKSSGYGRELSYYGIREFVNVKTVWVSDRRTVLA